MRFQSTRQCRICLQDISRFDYSSAVRPCVCKGTQQYVHHACLKSWLDFSKRKDCQICNFPFEKYKRRDGCSNVAQKMIKSIKFGLCIKVLFYYLFQLAFLLWLGVNCLEFFFKFYPSTSMLLCPTDYQNVTLQLQNETQAQDLPGYLCLTSKESQNSFPKVHPTHPLFYQLYDYVKSSLDSIKNDRKCQSLIDGLIQRQVVVEANHTCENLYPYPFERNFMINSENHISSGNYSQNCEKQDSLTSNFDNNQLNKHQHGLFCSSSTPNLTDISTVIPSDTKNQVEISSFWVFIDQVVTRPILLLLGIFFVNITFSSIIERAKKHFEYINENYRDEHLYFVEYDKTKQYQIMKMIIELYKEQQMKLLIIKIV
eukprot:403355504